MCVHTHIMDLNGLIGDDNDYDSGGDRDDKNDNDTVTDSFDSVCTKNMAHSTATNKDENAREATREDFQAVLDIEPHGYDGIDYLPATYSSLVEGPAVKGYVYEKNGKVVK